MSEETEKKSEEVVEAEEKETAEYEAGWEEDEKTEKDGLPVKADPAPEDDPDPEPEAKSDPDPDTVEDPTKEPVSKEYGPLKAMEKSVKDSRAHATKLQVEVDKLRKIVDAAEHGKATDEEVKQARLDKDEAEKIYKENRAALYEEYPELKGVIEPLVTNNEALKKSNEELTAKVDGYVEENDRSSLEKAFNENVKPHVLEKHADFDSIVTKEYSIFKAWAETQGGEMEQKALYSDNPDDIISAVTAYKEFKATGAAGDLKSEQDRRKQKIIDNASTIRGGSAPPTKSSSSDKDDYDAGWEEAGKLD